MSAPQPLLLFAAQREFYRAMSDPLDLIEIHRDLRTGPGRRTREVALNRAIVVLTVAAWQAYVQDAARAALNRIRPPKGTPQGAYPVLRGQVLSSVGSFATPNAENTRVLLLHVGFDPWPSWAWREGSISLTDLEVRERLNHWLKVRHSIAHGDDLPRVPVLAKTNDGTSTLRLRNARACVRFFERLTEATTSGLSGVLPDPVAETRAFQQFIEATIARSLAHKF